MRAHDRERSLNHLRLAAALWLVWTLATYLLEGRLRTLLRPDAAEARVAYAIVANLVIGLIGSGVVLSRGARRRVVAAQAMGFRTLRRTVVGIALGSVIGLAAFLLHDPVTLNPIILGNAFAQVLVVSVAEVLVCWVVLGTAVEQSVRSARAPRARSAAAWVAAAVAFGAYHLGHSPPFNSLQMVGLLTMVGLATGAFFFSVREVYGTILLHNFFALTGVLQALEATGGLDALASVRLSLVATALITIAVLATVAAIVRRLSHHREARIDGIPPLASV